VTFLIFLFKSYLYNIGKEKKSFKVRKSIIKGEGDLRYSRHQEDISGKKIISIDPVKIEE